MILDEKIIAKAMNEISNRRISAEAAAMQRAEQVDSEIPEIAMINEQLSKAGHDLAKLMISKPDDMRERIAAIRNDNLNAQRLIGELLVKKGYPADYLEVKYNCQKCSDTGIIGKEYCDCVKELTGRYAAEELNRRSQVKLSSFDSFDTAFYPDENDRNGVNIKAKMTGIFEYCQNYARSFSLSSPSLLMLGRTGLGKTHLSLAIAGTVISKGHSVAYDSIINYLRMIENERFGRTSGDTMSILTQTDLLILDDLGSEYESGFFDSCIYNIINTRLNRGLPTIISTNLTRNELQSRYNDRIISRIFSMYEYLGFIGNDIRQIKQLERMKR